MCPCIRNSRLAASRNPAGWLGFESRTIYERYDEQIWHWKFGVDIQARSINAFRSTEEQPVGFGMLELKDFIALINTLNSICDPWIWCVVITRCNFLVIKGRHSGGTTLSTMRNCGSVFPTMTRWSPQPGLTDSPQISSPKESKATMQNCV